MAKILYKKVESLNQADDVRVDVFSEKFKMNNTTSIYPIVVYSELNLIFVSRRSRTTMTRMKINL